MKMKVLVKRLFLALSFILAAPLILLTRIFTIKGQSPLFNSIGQGMSLIPGKTGSYLRVAYYMGTLRQMSPDVVISFGSFFSQRSAEVGRNVYIGAYCILGNVRLMDDILIASRVSIPSGKNQHGSIDVKASEMNTIKYNQITIGSRSWIGEGAIVMADVGSDTIIGSGSIVTKPIPDKMVAMGNPAVVRFERAIKNNA
jgi:acetyltransferase-like isoleucine patch superfamily enzyme